MTGTLDSLYTAIRAGLFDSGRIKQVRDLTRIDLHDDYALIIAVDSDGGIGPMPGDAVYCPAFELGRFAIRVPLLEILCSGATPLAAFDLLMMKMEPVGAEILAGIRHELQTAGLPAYFPISGSTEDNVPTSMTGVGTVVIGLVRQPEFKPGTAQAGDIVVCIGRPKSAPEDTVRHGDPEIVSYRDVLFLRQVAGVHDLLPVGSHGVAYEAEQLALSAGLVFQPELNPRIDLHKSGGPSTCVIVACQSDIWGKIEQQISAPYFLLGKLVTRK